MPLLEREAQLASLRQYAAEAGEGAGRLVLVSGEAGVGKSALLEALEQQVPARWLWSACDGQFTPRPLGPLLDLAAALGEDLQRLRRAAAPREELFGALLNQLQCEDLTVLVVEDVHWADEATLDLLRFLGRRIRGLRLLILVSYRDDALAPSDPLRVALGELSGQRTTRRLALPRLTVAAVERLAQRSGISAEELHRLTGGNPFFVVEVLGGSDASSVPASARDAVLARVAGLSALARTTLEVAALDGNRVDVPIVQQVTGAALDVVDELVATGLLRGDGEGLRFRHEIARLAVESTVAPHRRTSWHRSLLDGLVASGCDDDARLAYHSEGAGAADLVAVFAARAGRQAAALGAHRAAAAQFERALRFPPLDGAQVAMLHDELADQLILVDRWPDSAAARQSALTHWHQLGERRREGEDMLQLSTVMWRLCRGPESVVARQRAIELLEPLGPNPDLARAYSAQAFQLWATDPNAAAEMLDRAEQICEALGDPVLRSDVLNNLAAAQLVRGEDWTATMRLALQNALDARATRQAGRTYANAYTFYAAQFRFAEGERYWAEGIDYCDERDITTYSTCLRGRRTLVLLDLGRWDEAVTMAGRVLATEASPINLLTSQVTLGLVRVRRGDRAGEGLLDAAACAADGVDEAEWVALTRRARAEAAWLAGDPDAAKLELDHARSMITAVDNFEDTMVADWEKRLLGMPRLLAPPPEPYATQLAGDYPGAATRWDELGCPYHAALALFDSDDDELLRQAFQRFEELGANAAAAVTRQRMRELGIKSIPTGVRSATRQHPAGLTGRENDVLQLICEGLTNEEISRRLFISAKTVDHHVSAVLGKLGVPSRKVAAAEAARRGLVGAAT